MTTQDEDSTESAEPTKAEPLSFSDTLNSLTGYEEVEIEEHFGEPISFLVRASYTKAGRALIYAAERRAGAKPAAAFKTAMSLRLIDVNDRFKTDDEDAEDFDPESPDTEQGKDDSPSS